MVKPTRRELYVEGGGEKNPSLASECRRAFAKLFESAGVVNKPRVIVCGSRASAYEQFCKAHEDGQAEIRLLVDAESPASSSAPLDPWEHVKTRSEDKWERPKGVHDEQLHLMSVMMETWLLADRAALKAVFGPKLDEKKLPAEDASLEQKGKQAVDAALAAATKTTPAGEYKKGSHSFAVLAKVAPAKLRTLVWADRFLNTLGAKT